MLVSRAHTLISTVLWSAHLRQLLRHGFLFLAALL